MLSWTRLCDRCGLRWKQEGDLCRGCASATGATQQTTMERDRERLARQQKPIVRVAPALPPSRSVRVDGVEFLVMWDGS